MPLWAGLVGCPQKPAAPPAGAKAQVEAPVDAGFPVLWPVPKFSFIDQDAKPFTDNDLHGHVWVADYIFTQCTSVCPILTAQMKMVQRKVQGHGVMFLSFSVDPAHDDPAALKAYAAKWHGDESTWRLLSTGTPAALHALADAMQTEISKGQSPDDPIIHSERFVLIDGKGMVRGRYDSTDPDDLVKLADDSTRLASATVQDAPSKPPEPVREQTGEELFMSFGCQACHSNNRVAPPLEGLVGSEVMLDTRVNVKADDAYLRESIQDPMKSRVAGYVPSMPSYRNYLSENQVDALIGYLHSIANEKSAKQTAHVKAVDPVCHMAVSGSDDGPHALHQGKTYYFCSDACLKRFEANPAAFADRAEDGGKR